MKYTLALAASALFATSAFAGNIPDNCTPVQANWVTAPTYSCPIKDTHNTPFCDREGLSWKQKHEHGCTKCNHEGPKAINS